MTTSLSPHLISVYQCKEEGDGIKVPFYLTSLLDISAKQRCFKLKINVFSYDPQESPFEYEEMLPVEYYAKFWYNATYDKVLLNKDDVKFIVVAETLEKHLIVQANKVFEDFDFE